MSKSSSSSSGIGFSGLLTILFIGLKLTGYISWTWLWVLSPIWIGFIFVLIVLVLILLSNVAINKGGETLDSKALDPDATTTQSLPAATPLPTTNDTATPADSTGN